ncbi:von willebrand domain containing protein [Apiospora phragmitis]|uniref:von willebrand domain containing protein n=1 Tax=Apiospora phragmitis TaxID=2905665 RepID=A0ABR1X7K5_9PEZI
MASYQMQTRGICGFHYFTTQEGIFNTRSPTYLPQVKVEAHTSIISSIARTTFVQTFVNPGNDPIKQLYYTFPLFDGVSIVGFTCTVGDRVIKGLVKERGQAQATFDQAVAQGETAGLLAQAVDTTGDVFKTSVGNIPGGAQIKVDITCLGELKHDAQIDGMRLTIPTYIAPRYGAYPGGLQTPNAASATPDGGIKITVDAQVSSGSRITSIQSPSHQIGVTIGRTSKCPELDLSFEKASATLSLGTTELYRDFVLQMTTTEIGNPVATLEEHPSIPGQQAIMATLVPKFALAPEKPEVVFVCDRSGSMRAKIPDVKKALQLFVKSLTVGVKFNICSFGSQHSFLWDRSRTYDSASMTEAMQHIDSFDDSYGGTEMYAPIEQTIKRRYQDMNLEAFLLTDGEIWNQDPLIDMINAKVAASDGAIRIFTLGIGRSVSHSLIERVARAGNGFSQAIIGSEEMGSKVVRMLKGAMFPHVKDYTLEVKYEADEDEEYEVIDTPEESLVVHIPETKPTEETAPKKPISLFDPSSTAEGDLGAKTNENKFLGLPPLGVPKLLQAPHSIPPLFPFVRSTVYLLMSSETRKPESVVLRGKSQQGPLQLEIPITPLAEKGMSIHQLAARKAVGEIEEGRGWISHAKDAEGVLLKQRYDGKFQDMAEREAVRLGVAYQVGGKWCSFVAVPEGAGEDVAAPQAPKQFMSSEGHNDGMYTDWASKAPGDNVLADFECDGFLNDSCLLPHRAPVFNLKTPRHALSPRHATPASGGGLFGTNTGQRQVPMAHASPSFGGSLWGGQAQYSLPNRSGPSGGIVRSASRSKNTTTPFSQDRFDSYSPYPSAQSTPTLSSLVLMQSFEGSWPWSQELLSLLQRKEATLASAWAAAFSAKYGGEAASQSREVIATTCVVAWLRKKSADQKDSWELLVDKALAWLAAQLPGQEIEGLVEMAKGLV